LSIAGARSITEGSGQRGRYGHQRIAGSQLVIIEDASHLCFAEQPEEFNRVINSFMT
jgi:pimeloyl-ACP methyl ester carboxylesterase